jgi:hypothetical protein
MEDPAGQKDLGKCNERNKERRRLLAGTVGPRLARPSAFQASNGMIELNPKRQA